MYKVDYRGAAAPKNHTSVNQNELVLLYEYHIKFFHNLLNKFMKKQITFFPAPLDSRYSYSAAQFTVELGL